MGNLLSTSSTPQLYKSIKLLLADPEKQFPLDFNPEDPFEVKVLERASLSGFIKKVEREEGVGVVPLERFDPQALKEVQPEDVELRNGATYIIVPRRGNSYENRFEAIKAWQKNQTSGDERMLMKRAMKELAKTHTNVRPWCKKNLTGPDGWSAEIDACAIADGCVIIVEHKNVMDSKGAYQLTELCDDIDMYKDSGEGSVAEFAGLRIIGALAGPMETTNPNDLKKMNRQLKKNNCYKWFEEKDYGDDPCSPFQASGASSDAPVPTDSPGAPSAVRRRVGRLLAPMRGSAVMICPRLANRSAFRRPFF